VNGGTVLSFGPAECRKQSNFDNTSISKLTENKEIDKLKLFEREKAWKSRLSRSNWEVCLQMFSSMLFTRGLLNSRHPASYDQRYSLLSLFPIISYIAKTELSFTSEKSSVDMIHLIFLFIYSALN